MPFTCIGLSSSLTELGITHVSSESRLRVTLHLLSNTACALKAVSLSCRTMDISLQGIKFSTIVHDEDAMNIELDVCWVSRGYRRQWTSLIPLSFSHKQSPVLRRDFTTVIRYSKRFDER
ncbi:uncharacterized protein J3R85_019845 [Psidium guajava]|nr:uncharacterized protein J3R85_019845 [Psidium guajava]